MIRAEYTIELHGEVLALTGYGGGKSITNDADNVVEDLSRAGFLTSGARVIYLDSCGVWDELVVRDGRFFGFQSIGARDRSEALDWVKRNPPPWATVP
jgi:hypothetical protein